MNSALDDVVVLDATASFWASLAAGMLADFGAQVVKIESPTSNGVLTDYLRELADRNKRSLALDMDGDAGRALLARLVEKADVFITDASDAELPSRTLDYDAVSAQNPRLVYVRGTGYGPQGPDREAPALDELAAARTGLMPVLPQPGEPPVYTGAGQMYTTIMLAFGAVMALWHRDQTGEGQRVDASLFAGNMYGASLDIQAFLAMGGDRFLQPVSRLDAGNPMSGTLYPTQDTRWVTLTMPDTDRWWPGLSEITGIDAQDARFDSHEKRCEVNRIELIAVLEEAFQRKPASHWRDVIAERGLSADVIEEYSYPANDEQALRNDFIIERNGSESLGFPLYMSETPARMRSAAPSRGQHTLEVLRELLGCSDDEIARLRAEGAVA